MTYHSEAVSADVIWECVRTQNAFLVKRGGAQFSKDPLNLTNKHSRKYAGFVNDKAVGVISAGDKGGVTLLTKKSKFPQTPAASIVKTTFGGNKGTRKTYKGIASHVAKSGYRADLRAEAVSRASHIRASQLPKKDSPAKKLRGSAAKKASAVEKEE